MKIYHLVIAYNKKTEEIEYIQESVEEDESEVVAGTRWTMDYDPDYWDDETLLDLIEEYGLGEA